MAGQRVPSTTVRCAIQEPKEAQIHRDEQTNSKQSKEEKREGEKCIHQTLNQNKVQLSSLSRHVWENTAQGRSPFAQRVRSSGCRTMATAGSPPGTGPMGTWT